MYSIIYKKMLVIILCISKVMVLCEELVGML